MAVKEGRRGPRYVYEEMYVTSGQLKSGESEARAFAEIWKQMRAAAVQEVFRAFRAEPKKRTLKNLRETLRLEMADAFEQRKHQAKTYGRKSQVQNC